MAVNIYNQVPFNTYTPRSFQEMLAPVMYATEEESKLQQQYADTGSTIDKAMAYLNPELDKESYAKIQQYKTDLSKALDDLSTSKFCWMYLNPESIMFLTVLIAIKGLSELVCINSS